MSAAITAAAPTSAPQRTDATAATYYASSTRYKYGPSKCTGDRLSKDRLEAAAVLTQLADLYRDGRVIEKALAETAEPVESERPRVEEQLASTRAEIARLEAKLERYFEAFEDGSLSPADCQDRVRGHRSRLDVLREQEADLAHTLGTRAHTPPDTAAIAGLAEQLEDILANESPEQAKGLLRLLVKEIRVHDRRRIIPTYRIPAAVRATPSKVELNGALSNPLESDKSLHFGRLATLKSELSAREQAPDQPSERLRRRQGSVTKTVTDVLAITGEPMRVRDIHRAVEKLLGGPVGYPSVKEALSAHTRGTERRFLRSRRGYYQLLSGAEAIRTR